MPALKIQRVKTPELAPQFFRNLDNRFRCIRERAFEIYRRRGSRDGSDCDDWMCAERELFQVPDCQVLETTTQYHLRMLLPALKPGSLVVTALRRAIVVQGKGMLSREEFEARDLFTYSELSASIDIERVTATVDRGVLEIVAPKTARCVVKRRSAVA